ncbi:hypothetical protein DF185_00290 [Marinifilum breve]|uniref:Uncharacterized protein n=1 Tax=Marinifilum breve TaxID=2184082 RepID=A0A2V4A3U2_9BACT|nr:hypothetical protein DF185_00290 [Marinifilum breve]
MNTDPLIKKPLLALDSIAFLYRKPHEKTRAVAGGWVSDPNLINKQNEIIKINQLSWVSPTLAATLTKQYENFNINT